MAKDSKMLLDPILWLLQEEEEGWERRQRGAGGGGGGGSPGSRGCWRFCGRHGRAPARRRHLTRSVNGASAGLWLWGAGLWGSFFPTHLLLTDHCTVCSGEGSRGLGAGWQTGAEGAFLPN